MLGMNKSYLRFCAFSESLFIHFLTLIMSTHLYVQMFFLPLKHKMLSNSESHDHGFTQSSCDSSAVI